MTGNLLGVQLLWHDLVHVVQAPYVGGDGAAAASLLVHGVGHQAGDGVEAGHGHCLLALAGYEGQLAYRAGILAGGLQDHLELGWGE